MPSKIYVGTAGWSIPRAEQRRFPAGGSHLARYAQALPAVEINSTFHRPHRGTTFARWAASVPRGFRFSVKLPRTITHDQGLRKAAPLLEAFLGDLTPLGSRLGCLLAQLPPGLVFDARVARAFLTAIRRRFDGGVALEPRHASWFASRADSLLREFQIARVAADPPRAEGDGEPGGWRGLAYFRPGRRHGKCAVVDGEPVSMKRVCSRLWVCAALCGIALSSFAADDPRRTYANPVDVDYRYNFEQINERISYRTGADPVIVRHQDAYYLFMTLADGYWRSTNLLDWHFIEPSRWPLTSVVAPAAISDGDRLILMPSMTRPDPLLVLRDAAHGKVGYLTRRMPELPSGVSGEAEGEIPRWHQGDAQPAHVQPGPWDPALFKDDDGRWYLYWGSSNTFPLYGIELDLSEAESKQIVRYLGKPRALVQLEPRRHGWERFGEDHTGEDKPSYIEGAWMTKRGGRYYLQYGAPGTEYNVYATGTYVSDKPLGPFEYAPYNPVGYKPGGFVHGAGHGNTFQDEYGNWWNTGTPWIGHNWTFERRIALFPAAFSDDGQMSVNTRFGDFPHYMPTGKVADPESLFTGWMLLSYRKPVVASASPGAGLENLTDEDPRTFWVAASTDAGQTLTLDLGAPRTLRAVQVDFADYLSNRYADAPDIYTEFTLEHSLNGKRWAALARTGPDKRDRPNAYFQLPAPVRARYVRYVHGHVGAANLAISDLRVFGDAGGAPPATPGGVKASRSDSRALTVSWRRVPGAVGYNVRWGVKPDRLNLTYQVFADRGTRLELRALNAGVSYHVAVEAFDENGVSAISAPVLVR